MTQNSVVDALQAAVNAGRFKGSTLEFACSLLRSARSKRGLTPGQAPWPAKLLAQLDTPPVQTQVASDVRGIFAIFDTAAQRGLKYPKVHLVASDGTPVVFNRAGEKSQYTGQVMITDGGPYGVGRYFGRVDIVGMLTEGPKMTAQVRELVEAFAIDPARVAAEYGKTTGSCCFCSRTLETDESLDVGYGPVCADKFGLAWGTKKAKVA